MEIETKNSLKLFADEARFCTWSSVRSTSRALTQFFDDVYKPLGLRATQLGMLCALNSRGSKSISQLAESMVMDRTTVTRNIKRLAERGLLTVSSAKDHRVRIVEITTSGNRFVARAYPLWKEAQVRFVEGLGEENWRNLSELLAEVVSLIKQDKED